MVSLDDPSGEKFFGQVAVELGLVTPQEIAECTALPREGGVSEQGMEGLLVLKGYLSQAQVETVRREVERRQSSIDSREVPPALSLVGRMLGKGEYRLLRPLSQGGISRMYLAHQRSADRPVVIRVVHRKYAWTLERVLRAASLLGEHPNIVRVFEGGRETDLDFLATEYVPGGDCEARIRDKGPFSPVEALRVGLDVSRALAAAHEKGIVHRNVKPSNILLGSAKLGDFDLASLPGDPADGGPVAHCGTPAYMPPEQFEAEASAPWFDTHALGVTLFRMLTGQFPFGSGGVLELCARKRVPAPAPSAFRPSVPKRVDQLVLRLLDPEPTHRPKSGAEAGSWIEFALIDLGERVLDASDPAFARGEYARELDGPGLRREADGPTGRAGGLGEEAVREVKGAGRAIGPTKTGGLGEEGDLRPPAAAAPRLPNEPRTEIARCVPPSVRSAPDRPLHPADLGPTRSVVRGDYLIREVRPHPSDVARSHDAFEDRRPISPGAAPRVPNEPRTEITEPAPPPAPSAQNRPLHLHENAQFTLYRPRVIDAGRWHTLLAFAHLSERAPDAPANEPDPVEEVARQAAQVLGADAERYQQAAQDSRQAVPSGSQITFLPHLPDLEINPPSRSFQWMESVHREEFRLRAPATLEGRTVRGRLSVFLGSLLLAEFSLSIRVNSGDAGSGKRPGPLQRDAMRPYRRIFASYSRRDVSIVEQFERFARGVGDEYLRDLVHLRTGEVWDDRLKGMIEQADVFQLFWSRNSMGSPYVRMEWEHALGLNRLHFIRPVYWEDPLPADPARDLPPDCLRQLHFERLAVGWDAPPASRSTRETGAAPRPEAEISSGKRAGVSAEELAAARAANAAALAACARDASAPEALDGEMLFEDSDLTVPEEEATAVARGSAPPHEDPETAPSSAGEETTDLTTEPLIIAEAGFGAGAAAEEDTGCEVETTRPPVTRQPPAVVASSRTPSAPFPQGLPAMPRAPAAGASRRPLGLEPPFPGEEDRAAARAGCRPHRLLVLGLVVASLLAFYFFVLRR
ncbi:MAG: protein kinase [Planctomycetes bacterium]|nr:protein kinase [Planctomycetota bacterium]